ncbi:MAG: hypothetical protein M3R67_01315 [Acidobacteriota bacterium]|nr:hypothetical protein [Acidobacteriota bacterium]
MKQIISLAILLAFNHTVANSQTKPNPVASPSPAGSRQVQQREPATFDLAEYGVSFQAEPRLIIMMAALEAAGFDPTATGTGSSTFRTKVRNDLSDLDPDLRNRLRTFYERNKLPSPATAADQAARYVSLAFALGPPPSLDAPTRSEDLPASLLEVLDFAPLVQEFYRRSHIDDKLVGYTIAYQAEGDRLRKPTAEMVRAVLTYLHTRPITSSLERVQVKTPTTTKKKNAPKTYNTRERQRHFIIVPDLLGAPGAINFRVIGDEYYAVLPEGTEPASSELRRAYLQYVIDPLLLRFNRDVAARRVQIKQLLTDRERVGGSVSPDVFLAVSRSLVAAADANFEELRRLDALARASRTRLASARDESSRQEILKDVQEATTAIKDETVARLADNYERGAILAFFFAEQLKGIESSGFDVANFFVDMISSFDPVREGRRLAENAEARQRALAARQARLSAKSGESNNPIYSEAETAKSAALVKKLGEIEQILRSKDYKVAEAQLKDLLNDFPREPRIFFALAQTASFAAADAIDEDVQTERLNRALGNYRLAVEASSPETDRALISRAHEAMGRIHAFLENKTEAEKEFDAAISVGDIAGGAYKEAVDGKNKLLIRVPPY